MRTSWYDLSFFNPSTSLYICMVILMTMFIRCFISLTQLISTTRLYANSPSLPPSGTVMFARGTHWHWSTHKCQSNTIVRPKGFSRMTLLIIHLPSLKKAVAGSGGIQHNELMKLTMSARIYCLEVKCRTVTDRNPNIALSLPSPFLRLVSVQCRGVHMSKYQLWDCIFLAHCILHL